MINSKSITIYSKTYFNHRITDCAYVRLLVHRPIYHNCNIIATVNVLLCVYFS